MIPITCNAVGDILALAALVWDVARALNETRGSPAEYRTFIGELNSLHIVLASVARVAENTSDSKLRSEIVREVNLRGSAVQDALKRVMKFSALNHDDDTSGPMRIRLKRQWYKLDWHFGKRGNVREVQAELATATQRISMYLAVANADRIDELGASLTTQFNTMTAHFCTSIVENFAVAASRDDALSRKVDGLTNALTRPQATIRPNHSSSTRSGDLFLNELDSSKAAAVAILCVAICTMHDTSRSVHTSLLLAAVCILMSGTIRRDRALSSPVQYGQSNSITLHDALGRRLVLPMELCETYDTFHMTITNLFSRTKGRWFITAGRYALVRVRKCNAIGVYTRGLISYDEDNNESRIAIDLNNWKSDVCAGAEIEMSVALRLIEGGRGETTRIRCPVCFANHFANDDSKRFGYYLQGSREVICQCGRSLGLIYQSSIGTKEVEHHDPPVHESDHSESNLGSSDLSRARRSNSTLAIQPADIAPSLDRQLGSASGCEGLSTNGPGRSSLNHVWTSLREFARISVHPISGSSMSQDLLGDIVRAPSANDNYGLISAAENGHYDLVIALLAEGVDPNASYCSSGYTALHVASAHGYTRVVKALLHYGAEIDIATAYDVTPLACAIVHGRPETTAFLLARGSMRNANNATRAVVLYAAAWQQDIEVVTMITSLGVDVNTRMRQWNIEGETALHAALRSPKRVRVVGILLRYGADASACSKRGHTPLVLAAWIIDMGPRQYHSLCEALVTSLRTKGSISRSDSAILEMEGHEELLKYAVESRDSGRVKMVLSMGADANARFQDGSTALSIASKDWGRWSFEVLELLLGRGADVAEYAKQGNTFETALHSAVMSDASRFGDALYIDKVRLLLEHGNDANARSKDGHTVLWFVLEKKKELLSYCTGDVYEAMVQMIRQLTKLLLSYGAVPDDVSPSELQHLLGEDELPMERDADPDMPGGWREQVDETRDGF